MSDPAPHHAEPQADEVLAFLRSVLARQLLRPEAAIGPDDSLEALGLDSLGMVETLFALEERYDISIPFNANQPEGDGFAPGSVRDLAEAVRALIRARP